MPENFYEGGASRNYEGGQKIGVSPVWESPTTPSACRAVLVPAQTVDTLKTNAAKYEPYRVIPVTLWDRRLAGSDARLRQAVATLEKDMEISLVIEFAGAAILIAGYWRVVLGWLPEADRDLIVKLVASCLLLTGLVLSACAAICNAISVQRRLKKGAR